MADSIITVFASGTHNVLDNENIPQDAAQASENWLTLDGVIELIRGREIVGDEGLAGEVNNEWFGYKVNGDKVHFRKAGTKIQVLIGTTWTDVVTGLTSTALYSFANYSSLAGAFTIIAGVDGLYKINNANPTSFCSLYDATYNYKGKIIIDKGRTFLWGRTEDPTGLYGSKIDAQRVGTQYTAVTGEATTSLSGTLAFKAGGARRNCFAVQITLTGTGEVYTDNYLGVLTGSLGGTGTINYTTGAYTLSNAGTGTANYTWEDSAVNGLLDFRYSATRLAGEGFMLRQDEGGDQIMQVLVGPDGNYYSIKKQSVYQLTLDTTDLSPTNVIYRKDLGIPSEQSSVSTGLGIMFMNTANPLKPELTILEKNILGDALYPKVLFPHYKWEGHYYDEDTIIDYFGRYVVVVCKSSDQQTENDLLILADPKKNTVDKTVYAAKSIAKDGNYLYAGSPYSYTTYKLFSGFDDEDLAIENFWESKAEWYGLQDLKKFRKLRLSGLIDASQYYEVYVSYDDAGYQLVGTIRGDGSYVDYTSPRSIGSDLIGETEIGGGFDSSTVYPYYTELKLGKMPKFFKRSVKIVAKGIGYVSLNKMIDYDIFLFENRLPARYRQKQNVSLDGTETDMANPQF